MRDVDAATCEGTDRWRCTTDGCGSSTDASEEVCLPGSDCSNGPCSLRPDRMPSPLEGLCPLHTPALPCGAVTCQPGEACCWDVVTKQGRCATDGNCDPPVGSGHAYRLYTCRRPSDCGPGLECFNGTGSSVYEQYLCDRSACSLLTLVLGPILCDQIADCPFEVVRGDPPQTFRVKACQHEADDPPGVKSCAYR